LPDTKRLPNVRTAEIRAGLRAQWYRGLAGTRRLGRRGTRALRYLSNPAWRFATRVKRDGLTYLEEPALVDLAETVSTLEREALPGLFIEAGCGLGGSALTVARFKDQTRPLYVYDVFGTIPPPSSDDGPDAHARYAVIRTGKAAGLAGGTYYGYQRNLKRIVESCFARYGLMVKTHNVHLVEGLYEDTLRAIGPVAFAHIDCDWYSSVMTCLRRIEPRVVSRGVLVIDDYNRWSGCRKAVDEYFGDKGHLYRFVRKSRLHIVRK
jgi:hypothetical protein